jgi:HSP20 family protein
MNAVRWVGPGSARTIDTRVMDRVFENFLHYGAGNQENGIPTYELPVDILETEDAYVLYATVAGVPQDDVEVTFADGMLSIDVKAVPSEAHGKFIRQERAWGNWSRKLELPKEVASASIAAEFGSGVLAVRVPKAAKTEPVRIVVGAADNKNAV